MTISIKGRNIQIDDALAERHKALYKEPVDAMLVLSYLSAHFLADLEYALKTTPEKELSYIIANIIRTENAMINPE